MLRKALLIVLAIVVSFGLTGIAGYLMYANSANTSEATLSLVIRFAINPIIAILVGMLVGYLSKDQPALVGLLGLLPWAVMLLASLIGQLPYSRGQTGFRPSYSGCRSLWLRHAGCGDFLTELQAAPNRWRNIPMALINPFLITAARFDSRLACL